MGRGNKGTKGRSAAGHVAIWHFDQHYHHEGQVGIPRWPDRTEETYKNGVSSFPFLLGKHAYFFFHSITFPLLAKEKGRRIEAV